MPEETQVQYRSVACCLANRTLYKALALQALPLYIDRTGQLLTCCATHDRCRHTVTARPVRKVRLILQAQVNMIYSADPITANSTNRQQYFGLPPRNWAINVGFNLEISFGVPKARVCYYLLTERVDRLSWNIVWRNITKVQTSDFWKIVSFFWKWRLLRLLTSLR